MKSLINLRHRLSWKLVRLQLLATVVGFIWTLQAGEGKTEVASSQQKSTNSTNTVASASGNTNAFRSMFLMPTNSAEGRDPFFPRSARPYTTALLAVRQPTNDTPSAPAYDLKLNGISGTPQRRLAIINNHTFEVGEDAELPSGTTRIRVHCVDIKADSVTIQLGSEIRELRLRPGI